MIEFIFYVIICAFIAIGLIEGIKSIIEANKKKSGNIKYVILSLLFAVGVSFFAPTDFNILMGLAAFAFAEVFGYNVVTKWLFTIVDNQVKRLKDGNS